MTDLPKLPVKGPRDVLPDLPEVKPDIHTVDVPDIPERFPTISGWELFLASANCAMRQYVVHSVSGQIVGSTFQFWGGYASGVVSVLLLAFLAWKVGLL